MGQRSEEPLPDGSGWDGEGGREREGGREGVRGGREVVSRADGMRGEFRLVTMASIPWMLPECWLHQSDYSIHIITTFNPVCTGDVADREQNGALRETNRRCQDRPTKQTRRQIFDTQSRHLPSVYSWRKRVN